MPYTLGQNRLFQAAAHNPAIAKARGIPQQQASKLASEGVRKDAKAKLSSALMGNKNK